VTIRFTAGLLTYLRTYLLSE